MGNFTVRVVIDDQGQSVNTGKTSVNNNKPKKLEVNDKSSNLLEKSIKTVFSLGTVSLANGIVGNYTENRLRQKKINRGIKYAGYGLAFASGNPFMIAGALVGMGTEVANHQINREKINIKNEYLSKISGDTSQSGSRYRSVR